MKKQFCKHGHDTFICGRDKHNVCRECKREQYRKWEKANPEKAKESQLKWRKVHPEKIKEYDRKDRKNNFEKIKECVNKWNRINKERVNETQRKWENAHRESVRELARKYHKANPGKDRAWVKKSNLKRKHRVPNFGQNGITEFYANCPKGYEVDHHYPLLGKEGSGLHVIWNLRYLTKSENSKKNNKWPKE